MASLRQLVSQALEVDRIAGRDLVLDLHSLQLLLVVATKLERLRLELRALGFDTLRLLLRSLQLAQALLELLASSPHGVEVQHQLDVSLDCPDVDAIEGVAIGLETLQRRALVRRCSGDPLDRAPVVLVLAHALRADLVDHSADQAHGFLRVLGWKKELLPQPGQRMARPGDRPPRLLVPHGGTNPARPGALE